MAERTPLYSALLREAEKKNLRMHMPGIRESGRLFCRGRSIRVDMTELGGYGKPLSGLSPISDAERRMAEAAGAPQCFFLPGAQPRALWPLWRQSARPGAV
jgi:arginine/lysine/ornithine decarboxylase